MYLSTVNFRIDFWSPRCRCHKIKKKKRCPNVMLASSDNSVAKMQLERRCQYKEVDIALSFT